MSDDKVSLRVKELQEEFKKRNHVTLEQVLEQMSNWIMFDPLDIVDPDTDCVKSLKLMDKNVRMSISEIQVQELFDSVPSPDGMGKVRAKIGELKKVKFVDKRGTAEMFLKKFGAYAEDRSNLSDNLDAIKEIIEAVKSK